MEKMRKPVYVIVVTRELRAVLETALRKRFPGVVFTIVENASDACERIFDAEPLKDDAVPKVIVYCSTKDQRACDIEGHCGAIYGSGPKAKRYAPKIIIYASGVAPKPDYFETIVVKQPDAETLFNTIEGFLPRYAKKRKETRT
jgi:hypothetical protein